jgi:hypothetical protein
MSADSWGSAKRLSTSGRRNTRTLSGYAGDFTPALYAFPLYSIGLEKPVKPVSLVVSASFQAPDPTRTASKYLPGRPRGRPKRGIALVNLSTFARPAGIIACDFCVAVTTTFGALYVIILIEYRSRRLI